NFNSMELASELGSALYKFSLGVNLKNPDIIINLEIRNKDCFFYTKNFQGVGGLPPAISDKVLCLFSGGIDSPVAAFELIKRGCKVDFLFVNLVNNQVLNDVLRIYNFLIKRFCFGYKPKMFVVDGKKLVKLIKKETPDSLKQIAFKIVLYKISELIVRKKDYLAFATGESLSQKSSQTLKSLLFIENSVSTPVLRPLLCLDKIEITNIARKIGTLSSSEKIKEFCNLTTCPVSTSPREEDIQKIPCFDFEINKAVEDFYINKGIANMLPVVEKKISKTKKLVFVDVRSEALQKRNPLKVDLNIPYAKLSENIDIFKKDKEYLLICEFGVLSEDAASELRKKGFKAESIDINAFQKHLQ
ncbi:MAG: hypothetical protein KKF89_04695, partial [Nanoarchaeota archaeon]|nr:hypothetical protein [Nanoarchaeota archaeon]